MKVAVIGSEGVVGSAISLGFERLGHEVIRHDLVLSTSINDCLDSEITFICVPTPMKKDGSCNTDVVEEVVRELTDKKYCGIIAIKSTVRPGFTQEINDKIIREWRVKNRHTSYPNIAFVPEFLRERSAFADFTQNHDLCVIGLPRDNLVVRNNRQYVNNKIVEVHGKYPKEFAFMSSTEAELTKYFNNVYCAMKVVFANGFFEVCKKLNADYSIVKNAIVKRPVVEDSYLDVNDNLRGYAGYCYRKDLPAFRYLARELGVPAQIFSTIVEDNKLYVPTVFEGMRNG